MIRVPFNWSSATELIVDRTGRYLFAEDFGELWVFATGRVVIPEPPALALAMIGAVALLRVRSRSRAQSSRDRAKRYAGFNNVSIRCPRRSMGLSASKLRYLRANAAAVSAVIK